MGLIGVEAKLFDPEQRRAGLVEAAELAGLADMMTEDSYVELEGILNAVSSGAPETVAEYLDAGGRYVATLAVGLTFTAGFVSHVNEEIIALTARVTALENA